MKYNIKFVAFLLLLIVTFACSSVKEVSKKENVEVVEKQEPLREIDLSNVNVNCWINLMPGTSSKFHVSGKFTIPEFDEEQNIELKRVIVNQNNKMIYMVVPKVRKSIEHASLSIAYSTIKGLTLFPELDTRKTVDLVMEIEKNGNIYKYTVDNVKIEEVH